MRNTSFIVMFFLTGVCMLCSACEQTDAPDAAKASDTTPDRAPHNQAPDAIIEPEPLPDQRATQTTPLDLQRTLSPPIVAAARSQIGRTTIYDGAYVGLDYPNGDVPIERGVCTDVVIRALRDAHGIDLQQRVHEDMKANFAKYPRIWGLSRPDKNIDHRRVPNLARYFERKGYELYLSTDRAYLPGDLVTCVVGRNLPHIMIVSDRKSNAGVPLVIHNIGRGTREEDRLTDFTITGHYRIPPDHRP